MKFIQTEIRPQGALPVTIQVRSNERLEKMAQEQAEYERSIRDLENQIQALEFERRKLDQSQNYSLEGGQQRAETKRRLEALERQLAEQQSRRNSVADQHEQWRYEFAIRQYRRARLWEEYAQAREGPVSDWSYTKMYNIGDREQRTTGDVKRDLIDTITWILSFGGEDAALRSELQQLQDQQQ